MREIKINLLLQEKFCRGRDENFEAEIEREGISIVSKPNLGMDKWTYTLALDANHELENVRSALSRRNDARFPGVASLGAEIKSLN